jgi:hypothetical protein
MSGGLRKRVDPYLKIPSSTIRDSTISFRARGILAYLLDMPDEWDVRSEVVAANGKEGRGAVRTALHELGERGYYRIERRQMRTGKFAMGTAISERPVPEWADQYAEYDGKPVPVIEQADGSFRVKRKDGTLVPDGFEGHVSAGHTEDQEPVAGSPVAEDPDHGEPDSGPPQDGSLGALSTTHTQDRDVSPDDSLRSSSAGANFDQAQPHLVEVPTDADGASTTRAIGDDLATESRRIANDWWRHYEERFGKVPVNGNSRPFVPLQRMIQAALEAEYSETQIKHALLRTGNGRTPDAIPQKQRLWRELAEVRKGLPANGARQPSNVHHMPQDDPDVQRRAQVW